MPTNAVCLRVDGDRVQQSLREAVEKLDSSGAELVLDFSSVRRIDSPALCVVEELARAAAAKNAKVALQGVGVDVYKVFKLMKLGPQVSFPA